MEGRSQRERHVAALRESLDLGNLESVKRAADSLHRVGGDPVIALSSMVLNELPEGDQRTLALRALEHLDSGAAASVAQRLGVSETTKAGPQAGTLSASATIPQSGPSKWWIFGPLIALAVLWPAYSIFQFNQSTTPAGEPAPKPVEPQPEPRTAADILADVEKERAAGRPDAALAFARELVDAHGGTPEADTAAKQLPELEAEIKAAEEAERVRAAAAVAAAEAQRLADKWSYRVNEDPMTSRKSRFASIESENTVDFDFPYQGSQRGTLTLRDHPTYGRDVIFSIERGQLLCPSYDDCQVRVRFDEGSSERWNAVGPSDNSSTSIFIRNQARFVQKLRAAKVVRLQVRIYQQGEPMFEFQVGGFDNMRYKEGS